jgi:thiamine-monophosphate kinase
VGRRLGDVGEHAWIAALRRRVGRWTAGGRVVVGLGDDAAVVRPGRRPLLFTTDALVEDVHFRRAWAPPRVLGRRAFRVAASDVAAMGGRPLVALLAVEAPVRLPAADLDAFVSGVAGAARRAGARLVGGNLAAGPHLAAAVAVLGESPGRVVTRAGARPGDRVYVTGTVGGAGLAIRRLLAGRPARLPVPPDRSAAGVLLATVASAMIDVSDGLAQDAGHLARASGATVAVEAARVPVAPACRRALGPEALIFALTAGEDYELLLTVPAARERRLAALVPRLGCRLTRIGRVVGGAGRVRLVDPTGGTLGLPVAGFDHFVRRSRRSSRTS